MLASSLPDTFFGNAGIAHTRWATHGPRHNGTHIHIRMLHKPYGSFITASSRIIQSCAIPLVRKGIVFRSDTDTEVLAQLIGIYHTNGSPLESAVEKAVKTFAAPTVSR